MNPGARRDSLRAFLALLALSVAMSAPSFAGGLLGYDDQNLILGPEGALERSPLSFFTDLYYYAWLPFYGLSYWIDGRIAGGSPLFLHLMNALWHAAAGFSCWLVLRRLVERPGAALLGAALFVVHPLHVESVSWIAGRKELLSGFLLFLAWWCWLRESRVAAAGLFLAACFAKSSAVVLPAFLLLTALLHPRCGGARGAEAARTLPLFALAIVPVLVHLLVGRHMGVVKESSALGARAFAGASAWGSAILQTVLPVRLSVDYPDAAQGSVPGLLALAASVLALFLLRRRAPLASLSIALFLAGLAPFNGVFPATDVVRADRYLYLPLLGPALLAGGYALSRRWLDLAAGAAVALCLLLSMLSSRRFLSDERLWSATLETHPSSALASINRGLDRVGRAVRSEPRDARLLDEGIRDLERGLSLARFREHKAKAESGLVLPLLLRGRAEEATQRGEDALRTVEGSDAPGADAFRAEVRYNRGLAWNELGRPVFAARDFLESARLFARPHVLLEAGKALVRTGRIPEARETLARAAAMARESPDANLWLAQCARAAQNREEQRRQLEEAARRAPRDPAVVEGWVEFWLEETSPDYPKAQEALRNLPPGDPDRERMEAAVEAERALYLFRRGERGEAEKAADAALRRKVRDGTRLYELGNLYAEVGRFDDAVRCFQGSGDLLSQRRFGQDAVARAYALKAYALICGGDPARAADSFRAGLDARPRTIEAGAAPLRGEIGELAEDPDPELCRLAALVVAGDTNRAEREALRLLEAGLPPARRILVLRLRALLRLYSSRDFKGAESDLQSVLAERPADPWARFRLAQSRLTFGVGWMETAKRIQSASRRAEAEEALREAEKTLTDLLGADPGFHDARLARGEARLGLDDIEGAKEDFREVRTRAPEMKEVFPREATLHRLVYVRGGEVTNLHHAAAILEEALALDPNYFEALFELGNVYNVLYDRTDDPGEERQRSFGRAALYYRRAMALNPRSAQARREWANLCLKVVRDGAAAGKVEASDELLRRVEREAGEFPEVLRERVRMNLRAEAKDESGAAIDARFEEAKRALEAAERASPPADPELLQLRSLYHRRRGYVYYWAWVKLRDPEKRQRARELVVAEWRAAIHTLPEDPDNYAVRDRLREIAPEEIAHDREEADASFRQGAAAFGEGRFEEAARCFERAYALFPELVEARLNLAFALLRGGRREEAARHLEGVANGPDSDRHPEAMFELGNVYYLRRERVTAKVWYKRYVESMERLGRGAEESVDRARRLLLEIQ